MLTARGRWTIALGLIAGAAGRVLGVPELFGLATAVVVVTLAALLLVRTAGGSVAVTARAMPPVVNAGDPAVIELTIEESGVAGSLSTPVTLLCDSSQGTGLGQPAKITVPRLQRGDRARASFRLFTGRRGLFDAGAYEAVISDPLGLARRRLSVSRPVRCTVLPRIEPLATAVPMGLGWAALESDFSRAERFVTGSSMLRRYAQGDDLRRVHWRTTARAGELMVRDGGDRDEPDRIATTVLLDVGDHATPADELDRAVEVAASVLFVAADESSAGISGAYRLVTTTDLDTGGQRGHDSLQNVLIALAGLASVATPRHKRFSAAVERLGRPDHDEALVIVGAFGEHPPDPGVLEDLGRAYSAVVLVLVGAASSAAQDRAEARWRAGADGPPEASEIASYSSHQPGRQPRAGTLTVPLSLGRSLAAAWSLDIEGPEPVDDLSGWLRGAREGAR